MNAVDMELVVLWRRHAATTSIDFKVPDEVLIKLIEEVRSDEFYPHRSSIEDFRLIEEMIYARWVKP